MTEMLDGDLLREIGGRLRALRILRELTQLDVASKGGLSLLTVNNAERGKDIRLSTLIKIARILGRIDEFNTFLKPPSVSPLQLAGNRKSMPKRVRSSRG